MKITSFDIEFHRKAFIKVLDSKAKPKQPKKHYDNDQLELELDD